MANRIPASPTSVQRPPRYVLDHFGAAVTRSLGGRVNRHWVVQVGAAAAVLRLYAEPPFGAVDYEIDVLRHLDARGWPVPAALAQPLEHEGRTWCLFRWLVGAPVASEDDRARRARGRLLAELHNDLDDAMVLGQRPGCCLANEVLEDPELHEQFARYERLFPDDGRMLRWHAERAAELFAGADLGCVRTIVLHSDFTPWNLLYNRERLTGVLDFESTHRNYVVADFALAWRGKYDAVIDGYNEVRPLHDVDWAMLTPVFWSWLFLGMAGALRRIVDGTAEPQRLDWARAKLLVRSPLMGADATPYPG